jgi:hypothetical protein
MNARRSCPNGSRLPVFGMALSGGVDPRLAA